MLQAWKAPLARPTMDIDMLGRVPNSPESLESVVRDCAEVEVEPDGIEFDPTSVTSEVIVKTGNTRAYGFGYGGCSAKSS